MHAYLYYGINTQFQSNAGFPRLLFKFNGLKLMQIVLRIKLKRIPLRSPYLGLLSS